MTREAAGNRVEIAPLDFLEQIEHGFYEEMLINEIYSKERGRRVEVLGIQLDEMWSFVSKKENKKWIWLALNPYNRQIIAFHLGNRSADDAQQLYENIPRFFKERAGFFFRLLESVKNGI